MPDNSEFVKSIEDATLQIVTEMAKKMDKACLVIETVAKQKCPVDLGILRASITSETEVTGDAITGIIGSNEEYAPYVHNGTGIYAVNGDGRKKPWGYEAMAGKYKGFHWTRGQKPQPFLEKARNEKQKTVEKILGG